MFFMFIGSILFTVNLKQISVKALRCGFSRVKLNIDCLRAAKKLARLYSRWMTSR